jgi:hypothetical protein
MTLRCFALITISEYLGLDPERQNFAECISLQQSPLEKEPFFVHCRINLDRKKT